MTNKTENPRQIDLFNSAVERMKHKGCDGYFDIVAALEDEIRGYRGKIAALESELKRCKEERAQTLDGDDLTDDDTYFLIRSKRKISTVDVYFEE